ncbi:guanine nucleotide binding protein, alpha subunit [Armillaria gallica]|uniref:Guanine nucleotide binding protein, alpha subunit n=1 Tax=Armillaria gallica TaxID=47427 RepID=A0A2H3CU90_ARMGA|nr:guanine nucleotide binding protein, alpha subunit [Armillaria gallica]
MGNSASQSDKEKKARSDLIDKQLEDDRRKFKQECKVLLLGTEESGKSTIVRQMKVLHQGGFTPQELDSYRGTVYRNVLESAQATVQAMRKIGVDCENYSNRVLAEKILDYRLDETTAFTLSPEMADAIHQLWQDPIISLMMEEHSSEFHIMDSASYFFTEVLRIGAPAYRPTETDVLRARVKMTGITETRFNMGQLQIRMVEVGRQRSERRKWIHCFESVTSIIFCTALSEYDQVLLEERNQNRMTESLVLFESIDVFKVKLSRVPLGRYFPEYTGGNDINKAAKYILWRFMQANRARLSVYPHLTKFTDTTNVRLVSVTVKETVLLNALKDSNVLKHNGDSFL